MKITKFLVILLVIAAYFPAHAQRNDIVREIASFKGAEVVYMSSEWIKYNDDKRNFEYGIDEPSGLYVVNITNKSQFPEAKRLLDKIFKSKDWHVLEKIRRNNVSVDRLVKKNKQGKVTEGILVIERSWRISITYVED